MQDIIAYIIIAAAVVAIGVLLYRRFTRPDECSRQQGCRDCPLLDGCKKNQ